MAEFKKGTNLSPQKLKKETIYSKIGLTGTDYFNERQVKVQDIWFKPQFMLVTELQK